MKQVEFGGGLRVRTWCSEGHKMKWESTEFFNKVIIFMYRRAHTLYGELAFIIVLKRRDV